MQLSIATTRQAFGFAKAPLPLRRRATRFVREDARAAGQLAPIHHRTGKALTTLSSLRLSINNVFVMSFSLPIKNQERQALRLMTLTVMRVAGAPHDVEVSTHESRL